MWAGEKHGNARRRKACARREGRSRAQRLRQTSDSKFFQGDAQPIRPHFLCLCGANNDQGVEKFRFTLVGMIGTHATGR